MACNICGSHQGCCCGTGVFTLAHVGWACPACNKGNAPDAKTCGHCAQITIACRPPWGATDESMEAGDMDAGR